MRRLITTGLLATAMVALASSPAWAHAEIDPKEVPANTATRVEITVEHGCGTSPINSVATQLPPQAVDVTAEAPDGWTASVNNGVINWNGTDHPVAKDLVVAFTFTARADAGTVLGFPTVEACPNGESVRWIEDVPDSDDESQHPMPRITLTAGLPTPAATSVAAVPTASTAATAATTAASTAAASTTTPTASAGSSGTTSAVTITAAKTSSSSDGGSGAVIAIVAVLVVAAAGLTVWFVRRNRVTAG